MCCTSDKCGQHIALSVVDPGFPVGGGHVHPLGGREPPTRALFGENVCKNERIGPHRGGVRRARPRRSANAYIELLSITVYKEVQWDAH